MELARMSLVYMAHRLHVFGDDRIAQNLSCDIVIIRTSYDDLSLMAFLTDCPLALESAAARDGGGRCG